MCYNHHLRRYVKHPVFQCLKTFILFTHVIDDNLLNDDDTSQVNQKNFCSKITLFLTFIVF